jgi:hypothetical protein
MASKIGKFMRKEVYSWVQKNISSEFATSFPKKEDFWVVPMDKEEPEYQTTVDKLIARFEDTEIQKHRSIEGIGIAVLREGNKVIVCGAYLDGSKVLSLATDVPPDLQICEISFLQKIAVLSKLDITAVRTIDTNIWRDGPIFEADVSIYFPQMICMQLDNDAAQDPPDATTLRFLMTLEACSNNVRKFREELIEVMLSIPIAEHDWLVYQLLYAALAGRDSNFYSELYKIVEFFFPLHKVELLKNSLKYPGETLSLLELCMADLGWHVNHQLGSRLALNYASVSFAEVMLDKTFEGGASDEQRRFKEAAMEKITTLRHSLIHQSFRQANPSAADLQRATKALLIFLASSFTTYAKAKAPLARESAAGT